MKFSYGGLINNLDLAAQYHRAVTTLDNANPARGLWNRLLGNFFDTISWMVTPLDERSGTLKSNFVIERLYPNKESTVYLPWVLVQVKAQGHSGLDEEGKKAWLQELESDASFLSLDASWYMKRNIDIPCTEMFVVQISGVRMRVYKRIISDVEDGLKPLTGFLDPKTDPRKIKETFKAIKSQNFTETFKGITTQYSTGHSSTSGSLKRKLEDVEDE